MFWTVEKVTKSFPLKNQNQISKLTLFTKLQVKNLYEILKNSPIFTKHSYVLCNELHTGRRKIRKSWLSETAGNNLRIWFFSSGVIFLHVTFYWSCDVLNSSQGFSRICFCWCATSTAQKATTMFLSQLLFKRYSKLITLLYHPYMMFIVQEKTKLQNLI